MGYNLRPSTLVKTSLNNSTSNKIKKIHRNHPDDSDSETDDEEDIDYSENHVDYEDDGDDDDGDDDDGDDDDGDDGDDEDYDAGITEDNALIPIISISNSKNGGITFKIGKRRIRNNEDGEEENEYMKMMKMTMMKMKMKILRKTKTT